jgi:hypothetical protein
MIKKLTKNLEHMIGKLADLSTIKLNTFQPNQKSKKKIIFQP